MPGRRKCSQRSRTSHYTHAALRIFRYQQECIIWSFIAPIVTIFTEQQRACDHSFQVGFTGSARRPASIWRFGLMFASLVAPSETWELSVVTGLPEIKQICRRWKRSSSRKVLRLSDRLLLKSKQGLVFGLMMPRSAGNEKCCLTGTHTNDMCWSGNTSMLRFYYCFFVWHFRNLRDAYCGFYFTNHRLIFYFCVQNESLYKQCSLSVKWV